ncbi:MAG: 3-deoxy-manno-octulosonate cytidylyltransferase [Burkholderiales bacterium RIFCSPLOWO2_12_67_14]|nr:MAG: 3-deoxy-manno-octulosonate cytidylyltransferase [Burkholderiales bacterium RIFCSPLOWO2_02_FULL_67_64]OGB39012.1 MAG: 3-deoxy-manno-octulosonate cytidylyltransferase [Burkholderiales bacterium RIFCSPHIGHO2_12_FULL_67_38]OGB49660.1 MAG: 3-deoxy-manno-octulosonate cytidylyltransferase [Burkholderiales bacterium RIFCSPLOWO2_12_67_14]OGB92382.1 MAG: 3-deoxy-manno-octulosonate cytidylyltransferase [Burkholderiales bacterium RIFCSPLOWO2_12_FULL_67_210]
MSRPAENTGFTVLIPARLSSSRLPDKPLADIAGLPMVVRVAQRARLSHATRCVVAADDARIVQACEAHGIPVLLTRTDHPSGSDRLAEACALLGLADDETVVNVQGDEPLIEPALINAVATELQRRPDCVMSTAAHPVGTMADFLNPNVVKVVLDRTQTALYFSRAPIAWWRDGMAALDGAALNNTLPSPAPLRHIGIYGYRAGFLRRFPGLEPAPLEITESLEQLRVLWHGERIAVHLSPAAPGPGVDTAQDLERVRALLGAR